MSERSEGSERGAILLLALAYILIVSVIVATLSTWATNNLNNTTKFNSARSMDYVASSAVEVAINSIRYDTLVGPGETLNAAPPSYCWGNGPTSSLNLPQDGTANIAVWCSTAEDLGSNDTRTVTFYACNNTVSATLCATAPLLQAIVIFNDYPPGGSIPLTGQCSQYCGEGATLESWDWGSLAGTATGPSANSISVTSTPPAIGLIGNTYTPVATASSGDTPVVSSGSLSVCSVTSGVVTFVAEGNCLIDFNDTGNANYLAAAQVQQTVAVGLYSNVITVTSSVPTTATVDGPTYTPFATASSSDTVVVTSATPSTCSVSSNVVSFVAYGTCTINFNDPGNTDYSPAPQVQQTFSVANAAPAAADVQGVPSPINGKPDNGDSIQYIYNQQMMASSFMSGFSGSSTTVYVQLTRSNGSSTVLKVCTTSNCSQTVNLGTVSLGDISNTKQYTNTYTTVTLNATMIMSTVSGESIVTVTLGTVYYTSSSPTALQPSTSTTILVWTPSTSAQSIYGINCTPGSATESASPKQNF